MPRGLAKKTLALIAIAHELLSRIQPATVRGVCYQLFIDGKHIPNMSKPSTDRVSKALTKAREKGMVPWAWIVDETREIEHLPASNTPTPSWRR